MSFDLPWTSLARAARTWGLAGLAIVIAGVAVADWAANRFPPSDIGADDVITGSIAPRAPERSTRVIRSVLSDEPIVIRK